MEQPTASEVIGELKRIARQYEVFKHAEEMAQVLANFEGEVSRLKAQIEKLKVEEVDLNKDIEARVEQINKQIEREMEISIANDERVKAEVKRAADIVAKAKAEAESIKEKAEGDLQALKTLIQDHKDEELYSFQKAKEAKDKLDSILFEVETKKKQLLAAFS